MTALPPKVQGQHRWVSVTTRSVTRSELEAMIEDVRVAEEEQPVGGHLMPSADVGRIVDMRVMCIDCEGQHPGTREILPACQAEPVERRTMAQRARRARGNGR